MRCENCKNALIGRSRIVEPISSSERFTTGWSIISIGCKCNHKTNMYGEVNCRDYQEEDVK